MDDDVFFCFIIPWLHPHGQAPPRGALRAAGHRVLALVMINLLAFPSPNLLRSKILRAAHEPALFVGGPPWGGPCGPQLWLFWVGAVDPACGAHPAGLSN